MECARRDKKNIIGFYRAVFGHYGRTFDNRQNISLNPFSRNVVPRCARTFCGDFINFVDKNYTFLFRAADSFFVHGIAIDKLIRFFVKHHRSRFFYGKLAFLSLFGKNVSENTAYAYLRAARRKFHGLGYIGDVYFNRFVVVIPFFKTFRNILLENRVRRFALVRTPCLSYYLYEFCVYRRARALRHRFEFFFFDKADGTLHKVADHGFDVSAHVTDFRVLGSFYLDKRRADELCESSRDFGFANSRRTFHYDVFRRYFFHFGLIEFTPSVTVTESDRYRLFGFFLSDYIFIQFFYYLFRT